MRHTLIDRARRKQSKRPVGGYERVDWEGFELAAESADDQLLAVDEALEKLARDNVLIAQNPTKSLADDVAVTKSDCLDSEVNLVGHAARTLSAVR